MTKPCLHVVPVRYLLVALAATASTCLCSCSGSAKSTPDDTPKQAGKTAGSKNNAPTKIGEQAAPGKAQKKYTFAKPEHVKGVYLTAWTAGGKKLRDKIFGMIDRTELNAVVIDVRDTGEMYWKTGIKLADECHANKIAITKPEVLFDELEKHKIWPIARIACFRDSFVPKVHPEMAVQLKNGKVWMDRSKHMWLDPFNKKNWDYVAETVDYALDIGFPEIQLDYVRFPSEGKSATQVFPGKTAYGKVGEDADVIAAFTKFIAERVHKRGAVLSADVFGIISSTKGDEGIGQQLEKVAAPFDALSPMVYPSHFAHGEYGVKVPDLAPYEIIKKSLDDYKKRLPKTVIRPWLQDFNLNHVAYGPGQVKAQIKAAHDVGYDGFLLWNASNHYNAEPALGKKEAH